MPLSQEERLEFQQLAEKFRTSLAERLAVIQTARADPSPYQGDSLRSMFRVVHQLAGTGRAFGFPTITELAEAPEALLRQQMDVDTPPDDASTRELDRVLDRLCEEMARWAPSSDRDTD